MTFKQTTGAYTVNRDTFDGGCFVRTVNGKPYATGRNKLGLTVTLPLGVPLCFGCDAELDQGVCRDCEMVFTDVVLSDLGDGWKRAAA